MDDERFDVLTRHLTVLGDRRTVLRALAVGATGGLVRRRSGHAAFCKAEGNLCAANGDCCSSVCKKTKGKKKNGRRKKSKMTCRGNGLVIPGCVGLWGACNGPAECCGSLTCLNDMNRCCVPSGGSCSSTAECCTYGGLDVVCKAIDGLPQCCRPNGVYCYQDGQCCSGHCDGSACAP